MKRFKENHFIVPEAHPQSEKDTPTQKYVLVTGANGFLGSHLVKSLSQQGIFVRGLYRKNIPSQLQHLPHVHWQQCDLLDVYDVKEALRDVFQVYHCAAVISYESNRRQEIIDQNQQTTANLINGCLDIENLRFVHVSSIAALGKNSFGKFISEEEQWQETERGTAYGLGKYFSEMEVWRGIGEGLDAVIANPGIILGAGNWEEGSPRLMKVMSGGFPYYSQGVTAWVDVQDVVQAMLLLMNSSITAERFLLLEGNYPYKEVLGYMAESLGKQAPHKRIARWQTALFWRWEALKSFFNGKPPSVTKESAETAQRIHRYNNQKFLKTFPQFRYTSIADSISNMATQFRADAQKT